MDNAYTTFNLVAEFLAKEQQPCQSHEEERIIKTGIRTETGDFVILIAVEEDPVEVGIVIAIPFRVPERKSAEMMEAVIRANDGLRPGRFNLILGKGELFFKSTIPLADAELTHGQFLSVFERAISCSAVYHRAFGRLLFNDDLTPAEVVGEVLLRIS